MHLPDSGQQGTQRAGIQAVNQEEQSVEPAEASEGQGDNKQSAAESNRALDPGGRTTDVTLGDMVHLDKESDQAASVDQQVVLGSVQSLMPQPQWQRASDLIVAQTAETLLLERVHLLSSQVVRVRVYILPSLVTVFASRAASCLHMKSCVKSFQEHEGCNTAGSLPASETAVGAVLLQASDPSPLPYPLLYFWG